KHDFVRRRRSKKCARILRRDDGAWRRRHDAFAGILVRQGARSATFPGTRENAQVVPSDSSQPEEDVALQSIGFVPRIPDGQTALRLHPMGYADVQHFRLAKAVLFTAGWLR